MKWVYLVTYSCTFAFPLLQINLLQQIRAIKASAKYVNLFFFFSPSYQRSASKSNSPVSFPCCRDAGKNTWCIIFILLPRGCAAVPHMWHGQTQAYTPAQSDLCCVGSAAGVCRGPGELIQHGVTSCEWCGPVADVWRRSRVCVYALSLTRAALKFHHQNDILYG